jgi:hypothetical protein
VSRLLAAALGLAALVPLAPAAPVPKEADKPPLYFPTRLGDTRVWAWADNVASDSVEFTEVVTEVESKNGTKLITVETTSGKKYRCTDRYSLSEKGLFRLAHDDHRYDRPWCVLKAPYRAGDKWAVDVVNHHGVGVKSTHTIGELEWVEVPAGKFRALRVDTEHDGETPRLTATSWYAPNVGLVKMVPRSRAGKEEGAFVLKSFTPGKD